jgi:hypothetical protein
MATASRSPFLVILRAYAVFQGEERGFAILIDHASVHSRNNKAMRDDTVQ